MKRFAGFFVDEHDEVVEFDPFEEFIEADRLKFGDGFAEENPKILVGAAAAGGSAVAAGDPLFDLLWFGDDS